jgi:hypothetical protein
MKWKFLSEVLPKMIFNFPVTSRQIIINYNFIHPVRPVQWVSLLTLMGRVLLVHVTREHCTLFSLHLNHIASRLSPHYLGLQAQRGASHLALISFSGNPDGITEVLQRTEVENESSSRCWHPYSCIASSIAKRLWIGFELGYWHFAVFVTTAFAKMCKNGDMFL